MKTLWYVLTAILGIFNLATFLIAHSEMWWAALGLFCGGICLQQFFGHVGEKLSA